MGIKLTEQEMKDLADKVFTIDEIVKNRAENPNVSEDKTPLDEVKTELKQAKDDYRDSIREYRHIEKVLLVDSRLRKKKCREKIDELREEKKKLLSQQ